MGTSKFCPKCEVDRIKVELKLLPTKFLTCEKCQTVYSLVDNGLRQVAI